MSSPLFSCDNVAGHHGVLPIAHWGPFGLLPSKIARFERCTQRGCSNISHSRRVRVHRNDRFSAEMHDSPSLLINLDDAWRGMSRLYPTVGRFTADRQAAGYASVEFHPALC